MTSWHPGNPRPPNFSDGPQAKKPASIVIYRHATIAPTGSNRSLAILMPPIRAALLQLLVVPDELPERLRSNIDPKAVAPLVEKPSERF